MQLSEIQSQVGEQESQPPGILFPVLGEAKTNQQLQATLACTWNNSNVQIVAQIYFDFIFVKKQDEVFCMNFDRQIFFQYDIEKGNIWFMHKETKGRETLISKNTEELYNFVEILKRKCSQQRFNQKFVLIQEKNKNKTSQVYIVQRKLDLKQFAVKIQNESSKVFQEIEILMQLKHPNIIYFREYFIEHDNTTYIVMDYQDGGSLLQKMKVQLQFTYKQKLKLIIDLLNALQFLRIKGIVHRDIKPQNILYSKKDDKYKIADFGLAMKAGEKILKKSGTPGYMAPQLLQKDSQTIANVLSDIYSVGLTLYEIFTKNQYYSGSSSQEILGNNAKAASFRRKSYKSQDPYKIQKKLLQKMIRKNPNDRKNSIQIMQSKIFSKISLLFGKESSQDCDQQKNKTSSSEQQNFMLTVKKLFKTKTSG